IMAATVSPPFFSVLRFSNLSALVDARRAFMRGVAVEQAQNGVRANVFVPGRSTQSGRTRKPAPWTRRWKRSSFRRRRWLGVGRPKKWRMFTHSDAASYVTGALYVVDGGTTIA